jgi:ATP-dependent DNA ligase
MLLIDQQALGAERKSEALVFILLARETDEGLEYVGGAMLTLPDAEREVFWAAMEQLGCDRPPLKVSKRSGACWTKPMRRVRVRHLRGEGMMRHGLWWGISSSKWSGPPRLHLRLPRHKQRHDRA